MDSDSCFLCPFHLIECLHGLCAYNVPPTVTERMDRCPCNYSKENREFTDNMARARNINKRSRLYAVRYFSFDEREAKPKMYFNIESLYKLGNPDHLYMGYITENNRIFWLAKLQPPKIQG